MGNALLVSVSNIISTTASASPVPLLIIIAKLVLIHRNALAVCLMSSTWITVNVFPVDRLTKGAKLAHKVLIVSLASAISTTLTPIAIYACAAAMLYPTAKTARIILRALPATISTIWTQECALPVQPYRGASTVLLPGALAAKTATTSPKANA